jgi:hypothetical protein
MTLEIKAIIALVAAIGILGGLWYYGHAQHASGFKEGANSIQTQWDADREAIQKTADDAVLKATKDRDDAIQANEALHNDYQTQISSARALNGQLAQRLRDAQNRVPTSSGSVPKAGSGQGSPPTGGAPTMGQIDDAIAATLTECANNRAQLNTLISEIQPQL